MGERSRIRSFRFHEVIVRTRRGATGGAEAERKLAKGPIGEAPGRSGRFDEMPKLVCEMTLEDGTIGLGEFYRGHDWKSVEGIARYLVGKSLSEFPLQALPIVKCREYDGFECAVWDAYARSLGVRVVELLGGQVRDGVPVGARLGRRPLDEIGDLAKGFARKGYDCITLECDRDDDVAGWCWSISKAAPRMRIILDAGERSATSGETRRRTGALAEIGNVLCIENPLPRWMVQDLAERRGFSPIPLAVSLPSVVEGDCSSDAVNALMHRAVDGFSFNGGLAAFQRLDHITAAASLPCRHGSELDLGVLEAMYLHSCAAAQSCSWPSDLFGRLVRSHDLLVEPLDIRPPVAHLPNGSGLGVELDPQAVKEHRIREMVVDSPA